jgi:hypothetical protein
LGYNYWAGARGGRRTAGWAGGEARGAAYLFGHLMSSKNIIISRAYATSKQTDTEQVFSNVVCR